MDVTVHVALGPDRVAVAGAAERNLKMIREALGVQVTSRDGRVQLRGDRRAVSVARSVLERLGTRADQGTGLTRRDVLDVITAEVTRQEPRDGSGAWDGPLDLYAGGKDVAPRTANQSLYVEAIRTHDLVFATGPAGTGKTYLAVAAAVHLLKADRVRRLVLVRPAVEAGEKLGFLPGDVQAKVNPYLRPLFDALHDLMDYATIRRFLDSDVVEVAPLAFMRGRTLNSAVIILDEAQNTTRGQMQMFLTRMGQGSKTIVTGDMTQIDLPDPRESGLIDAARRLRRVPGVAFVTLDKGDVVRHDLVQRIVEAYGEEPAARRPRRAAHAARPTAEEPGP